MFIKQFVLTDLRYFNMFIKTTYGEPHNKCWSTFENPKY